MLLIGYFYLILCTITLNQATIAFQAAKTARIVSFGTRIVFLPSPTTLAFRSLHRMNPPSNDGLQSPIESHGKTVPSVSTTQFIVTAACIPVWAVTVLPLSIAYQLGKRVLQPLLPSSKNNQQRPLDSGYVVDPSMIIPRAERKYDIVVLGVTGFTGYLAARHLLTTYGLSNNGVHWAIAGRSREKLEQVKQRLAQECHVDTSALEVMVVDTSMPSTLPQLVQHARVVATTAGPYTLYGSSVVEFCAKFGTHYVDITGEVDWVKAMLCQWQNTAQQTGAKIIPFCGHGVSFF